MKLKDFLELARFQMTVEIRDETNMFVCNTSTSSIGVKPYLDFKIIEWFVPTGHDVDVVFSVQIEEDKE